MEHRGWQSQAKVLTMSPLSGHLWSLSSLRYRSARCSCYCQPVSDLLQRPRPQHHLRMVQPCLRWAGKLDGAILSQRAFTL